MTEIARPAPGTATAAWQLYTPAQRTGFMAVLFLVSTSQFFDRNVISVLLEPIKQEFQVSDTLLGLLGGLCFATFYAIAGLPVARWADRGNRRTIITLALCVWSVMTMLCGAAQTFWQLALARIGVGAGESGGLPPAQSLIADYFSPGQRTFAIAILTSGAFAGNVLGIGLGGYIAAGHGWRQPLLIGGACGLLLAVLVRWTLPEPRQRLGFQPSADRETFAQAWRALARKRSYVYALAGANVYFLFAYGVLVFIPSYMMRVMHISMAETSLSFGLTSAAGSLIGALSGGRIADILSQRDVRWLSWFPAAVFVLAAPLMFGALQTEDLPTFLVLVFLTHVALTAGIPTVFSCAHALCGSRRRTTAIALVYFTASLVGGGLGPLMTGALSDLLGHWNGTEGLRYSMISMTSLLVASAALLYVAGRSMPGDLEE